MSTIVLTGGGTAGHILPNLRLVPHLRSSFNNIVYVGSNNGMEKLLVADAGLKFYGIDAAKLDRAKILKNITLPIKFAKAIKQAKSILKTINPNVVFSKGGYVSLPVVIAAKHLNIPVVCHESDLSLGLANKIAKNYADVVCTTFKQTADKLKNKGVHTGSPVASNSGSFVANTTKPILVITGGSLGSKAINSAVAASAKNLAKNFYVIHQVGKNNLDPNIKIKDYVQIEFADNLNQIIASSALVVSRAGSNTIYEIAKNKKPMLLVPLPKSVSRGDQIQNAQYFEQNGYAKVLLQENLTPENLQKCVFELYKDKEKYINNLKNANFVDGTPKIAEILIKYAK